MRKSKSKWGVAAAEAKNADSKLKWMVFGLLIYFILIMGMIVGATVWLWQQILT